MYAGLHASDELKQTRGGGAKNPRIPKKNNAPNAYGVDDDSAGHGGVAVALDVVGDADNVRPACHGSIRAICSGVCPQEGVQVDRHYGSGQQPRLASRTQRQVISAVLTTCQDLN